MKELDGEEIVARLREMDKQLICGSKGDTIFKQAADLIELLKYPHKAVRGKQALVLFFATSEQRQEFIDQVRQVKPNLRTMKL